MFKEANAATCDWFRLFRHMLVDSKPATGVFTNGRALVPLNGHFEREFRLEIGGCDIQGPTMGLGDFMRNKET